MAATFTALPGPAPSRAYQPLTADHCHAHPPSPAGARWDAEQGCLRDSLPNQLRQALPVLLIRPVTAEVYQAALQAGDLYLCPLYTNMQRANVSSQPDRQPLPPAVGWAVPGMHCLRCWRYCRVLARALSEQTTGSLFPRLLLHPRSHTALSIHLMLLLPLCRCHCCCRSTLPS